VLVVAQGELLPIPPPRSLLELRKLMALGVGLCIRRAEAHDPRLARLTSQLAECLQREVHLQLFVTPARSHGFSWHYDAEDVFIVQTSGTKDYFFRANTVDPRPPDGTKPDFSRYCRETSPLQTAQLIAGDCLYIPTRWWHMAKSVEDSLSLSFGVSEPPSGPAQVLGPGASARACTKATARASVSRSALRSK
jgi:50S ribosomal protein L16 3-hydroxylase